MAKRDWAEAHAKLEAEGKCRVCKRSDVKLEKAHTIGRKHDRPRPCSCCDNGGRFYIEGGPTGVRVSDVCPVCNGSGVDPSGMLWVNPHDTVPLCGPATDAGTCHNAYDSHKLDLLPYLTLQEQLAAVKAAGGLELARTRLAPLAYRAVAK